MRGIEVWRAFECHGAAAEGIGGFDLFARETEGRQHVELDAVEWATLLDILEERNR